MSRLTAKDKEALAYLYETDQYAALKKFCEVKRTKIANQLVELDMSIPGNDRTVTFLQGQAKALEWMHLELKSIHAKQKPKD